MKILVTTRLAIEAGIDVKSSYIVISIHDADASPAKVKKQPGLRAVLPLGIDDIDPTIQKCLPTSMVMNQSHANAIWDFIDAHRDVETIVVHCTAGYIRSPAIAAGICKVMGLDEQRFFRDKDPNLHMYRLMVEVGSERASAKFSGICYSFRTSITILSRFELCGGFNILMRAVMAQQVWLFQAVPSYRLLKKVPPKIGKKEWWHPKRHLETMQPGDKVILWQTGIEAGAYAIGTLAGKPFKRGGEWRIDIAYDRLLRHPHYKSDLQRHLVLQHLQVLKQPWAANPFRVEPKQWQALIALDKADTLNVFSHYKQEENQFTNGLVSLLALSHYDRNTCLPRFLYDLLAIKPAGGVSSFRVLRHIDGTADAELVGPNCCIRIESKIIPDSLEVDQVQRHLERLRDSAKSQRALVLLTPDDGSSRAMNAFMRDAGIKQLRSKDGVKVLHLQWKQVYDFLHRRAAQSAETLFSNLTSQYLRRIRDVVFEHDYVGGIQKIAFGDEAEVYAETTSDHDGYLDQMRNDEWSQWHTPTKYKKLDGKGRKMLFYDSVRKQITAEVEIAKVEEHKQKGKFHCRNTFVPGTLMIYSDPIPLARIKLIPGLENFTRGMAAFWNLTRSQYEQLQGAQC